MLTPLVFLATALAADTQTWTMPNGVSMRVPGTTAPAGTPVEQVSMFFWPAEQMFAANVNVQRQASTGLDEFISLTKAQFPMLSWTLVSDKRTTIAGRPAWRVEYTGNFQGSNNHWDALAIEAPNHDIWLATCTSLHALWSKYQPLCGQALQSFTGPK
jgi:hypothetical protein